MPKVQFNLSQNDAPLGSFTVEVDEAKAPISSANFVEYARSGFYEGTTFHRVIPTFMVQGGGHLPDLSRKPTRPAIKNEWTNGLKNVRGTVAMARLGGNPDSATGQFFVNVVDNAFLDRPQPDGAAYAVFGRVVEGMEVVDKIRNTPTRSQGGMQDVPKSPVVITSAKVIEG
ncbi:MAG: peptidylprolyl isomerase A [Phycisphaerae bacterium]|nr:peptidylprolyl isomerase A [Phycisphaerae bacterium]